MGQLTGLVRGFVRSHNDYFNGERGRAVNRVNLR